MRRWAAPGRVVALVVLLAGALVVLASRTWVTGRPTAEVVGAARIAVTGAEAAQGLVALALAAVAAVVAAATARRIGRRISLVLLTVVALGLVVTVVRVVPEHERIVGELAARAAGHTGRVAVTATLTPWAWLGLVVAVLLLAVTGLAWRGQSRWRGLSDRYAPADPGATGPRGERVASDWDRISRGEDPTADGARGGPPAT